MIRVAVFVAVGFEEIEAISIVDVLRRATIHVTTVSITGNTQVTGSHNITVIADDVFENIDFNVYDMLVLPGGMPGAKNLNNHEGLKDLILKFNRSGKYLGAICAAPLVFGQLGLLKGKNATCYPGYEPYLEGANFKGTNKEVAGNIITGKGAGVAIEFALQLVKILQDETKANELAIKMIAD